MTLWASWVVTGPSHRIFHSGDTGYFSGFKEIGAAHGPFDATMIQIGAYSDFWTDIHMTPAEGMRAHLDLQGGAPAGVMLPIHWGTFNLAPHPWAEPGEGTVEAAAGAAQRVALPIPGEPFEPGAERLPETPWWRPVARVPAGGWGGAALTDGHEPLTDGSPAAADANGEIGEGGAGRASGEPGTDAGRGAPETARTP